MSVSQITRLHSADITKMLKQLVDLSFFTASGRGRATTYTLPYLESIDMADGDQPFAFQSFEPPSKGATSGAKGATSADKQPVLPGLHHQYVRPKDSTIEDQDWNELNKIAESFSGNKRMTESERRAQIKALCSICFLTKEELSVLMGITAKTIANKYLTPMTRDEILEHQYPTTPNHERQAYRTKESKNNIILWHYLTANESIKDSMTSVKG